MDTEELRMLETRWSSCKYLPEYDQQLIDHLSAGYSFMSFTAGEGAAYSTLIRWCKRFPSFQEAREIGEKARLMLLESEGLKMVKGGNVVAWKFMMNQMGQHETTEVKKSVEVSISPHMQVSAPIRYQRLQKLKELHQRVTMDGEVIEAQEVVSDNDDDLDLL